MWSSSHVAPICSGRRWPRPVLTGVLILTGTPRDSQTRLRRSGNVPRVPLPRPAGWLCGGLGSSHPRLRADRDSRKLLCPPCGGGVQLLTTAPSQPPLCSRDAPHGHPPRDPSRRTAGAPVRLPARCGGTRVLTGTPAGPGPARLSPGEVRPSLPRHVPQGPASWEPRGRSQTLPTAVASPPAGPGLALLLMAEALGPAPSEGPGWPRGLLPSSRPPHGPWRPWARLGPVEGRASPLTHESPDLAVPTTTGRVWPPPGAPRTETVVPGPGVPRPPGHPHLDSGGSPAALGDVSVLGFSWASPGSQRPGCESEECARGRISETRMRRVWSPSQKPFHVEPVVGAGSLPPPLLTLTLGSFCPPLLTRSPARDGCPRLRPVLEGRWTRTESEVLLPASRTAKSRGRVLPRKERIDSRVT